MKIKTKKLRLKKLAVKVDQVGMRNIRRTRA